MPATSEILHSTKRLKSLLFTAIHTYSRAQINRKIFVQNNIKWCSGREKGRWSQARYIGSNFWCGFHHFMWTLSCRKEKHKKYQVLMNQFLIICTIIVIYESNRLWGGESICIHAHVDTYVYQYLYYTHHLS